MTQTLEAVYDGKVFLPKVKVDLAPNSAVKLTFRTHDLRKKSAYASLRLAATLKLNAPSDFSKNLDAYLDEAVMKHYDIRDALTADEHFEQAGFKALLRNS